MHKCLTLDDILSEIFLHVPSKTLARLARTCRIFHEPALDALWADLHDLSPLIRCLPRDLWSMNTYRLITFQRTMNIADWDVFARYSRRVRSIIIRRLSYWFGSLEDSVLRVLCMPPIPPESILFPNLRRLVCDDERDEIYPFLRLLLGPKLTEVSMLVDAPEVAQLAILPSLAAWCPSIKKAKLYVSSDMLLSIKGAKELGVVSDTICEWMYMEELACSIGLLDDKAILHLGKLNSLRSLHLAISSHPDYNRLQQTERGKLFQNLIRINLLAADSLSSCTSFLLLLSSLPAEVTITPHNPYQFDSLRDFFCGLSAHKSPDALESVTVSDCFDDGALENVITIKTLQPLFGFHRLRKMNLKTFYSFSMDDDALKEIGSAFPLLSYLSLKADYGSNRHSRITINGLIALLGLCPNLTSLSLTIDARGVGPIEPEGRPGGGISNFNIESLSLEDSKIDDPRTVAAILFDILPRARVHAWEKSTLDDSEIIIMYRSRWKEVDGLLETFRNGGEAALRSGAE